MSTCIIQIYMKMYIYIYIPTYTYIIYINPYLVFNGKFMKYLSVTDKYFEDFTRNEGNPKVNRMRYEGDSQ